MAKVEVNAGICGFTTTITAQMNGDRVTLDIQSDCESIRRMAQVLSEVDPLKEISYRRNMPQTLETAAKFCKHTACPVPVGIIKAVEVEANLALPADVIIKVSRSV